MVKQYGVIPKSLAGGDRVQALLKSMFEAEGPSQRQLGCLGVLGPELWQKLTGGRTGEFQ